MGEKFRRWVRNFGDERANGEIEKEKREENRNNVLMREKFWGKTS